MKKNKGFTLVEIIVILVILAIMAAILIPSLTPYIDKAKEKQITSEARSAYIAAQTLISETYAKYDGVAIDSTTFAIQQITGTADPVEVYSAGEIIAFAELTGTGTITNLAIKDGTAQITAFKYTDTGSGKTATHNGTNGAWIVS